MTMKSESAAVLLAIASIALANSFNLAMHQSTWASGKKLGLAVKRGVALADQIMLKGKYGGAANPSRAGSQI